MRRFSFVLPLVLGVVISPAVLPHAADAQKMEKEAAEQNEPDKITGRLPNYYGKVGVSDEQRRQIYIIQNDYDEQIEPLLDEIEELRAERDTKVTAVLTDEQRAEVQRMRVEARARRASR